MKLPQKARENLTELARAIKEFQIRHNLICDTLAEAAGIEGRYKIEGNYDEIVGDIVEDIAT